MHHMRPVWRAAGVLSSACTLASTLLAQDVTVSDPTWLDPLRPSGDTPPAYIKRLAPSYPKELAKNNLHGYALAVIYVHPNGENLGPIHASHPHIEEVLERARAEDSYKPATKDGQPIGTGAISTLIFNPGTTKTSLVDSAPRLLAAQPIAVPENLIPKKVSSLTIPSTLHLDSEGKLTRADLPADLAPKIKAAIDASLPHWSFSPARKAGQPVDAQLTLPLVIHRPLEGKNYDIRVPVKPITRVEPKYPYPMRHYNISGEVLCCFIVDKNGDVKNAFAMASSHPVFTEAALEAVREWKFKPATINGVPVYARTELPIAFNSPDGNQTTATLKGGTKDPAQLPEGFRYDKAPQPRTQSQPIYPHELLVKKTSGHAKVVFAVGPDGEVKHVKIVEATHPEFGHALAAAASTYRFKPATLQGQPAAAAITLQHDFDPADDVNEEDLRLLKTELKHPEKILKSNQLDIRLKPLGRKPPKAPIVLIDNQPVGPGEAQIKFLIDESGKVRLPRIVSATTLAHGYAAIQAVAEWEFSPPLSAGKPALVYVIAPIKFNLPADESAAPAASAEGSTRKTN